MAFWPLNYILQSRKRAWASLSLLIFIIALTAIITYARRNAEKLLISAGVSILPEKEALKLRDEDKDGLQNWEEAIYGTDPQNPDTDGDGTNDMEEIRGKRDPLKSGPDDALSEPEFQANSAADGFDAEPNLTEELGKLFLEKYIGQKSAGAKLNPQLFSGDLVKGFLSGRTSKIFFPTVKKNEIKISDNSSPEAVKKYFNSVALITKKNLSELPNSFVLLAEVIKSSDITALNDPVFSAEVMRFDPLVLAYQNAVRELKDLPAPKGWEEQHEDAINSMLKMASIMQSFRDADKDIVKALMMTQVYEGVILDTQGLIGEIRSKLNDSKISFNSADPAKKVFGL